MRIIRGSVGHGVVYGCSVPGDRSFALGTQALFRHRHLAGVYAVAGAVVAYAVVAFGVDTEGANVLVQRLSDGALLGSYPDTYNFFGESVSSVGSLVVRSDGAAAWIGKQTSIAPRGRSTEVVAASPSASTASVLDSGSAIDPASLRLHGSTLSWRHGRTTRRATLH